MVAQLGRLPELDDEVVVAFHAVPGHHTGADDDADIEHEVHHYQLRVAEMDGRRIARIRITRLPEDGGKEPESAPESPEPATELTSGDHSPTDGGEPSGQAGPSEEIPGEPDQSEPRI
jgi:hypothetical protein